MQSQHFSAALQDSFSFFPVQVPNSTSATRIAATQGIPILYERRNQEPYGVTRNPPMEQDHLKARDQQKPSFAEPTFTDPFLDAPLYDVQGYRQRYLDAFRSERFDEAAQVMNEIKAWSFDDAMQLWDEMYEGVNKATLALTKHHPARLAITPASAMPDPYMSSAPSQPVHEPIRQGAPNAHDPGSTTAGRKHSMSPGSKAQNQQAPKHRGRNHEYHPETLQALDQEVRQPTVDSHQPSLRTRERQAPEHQAQTHKKPPATRRGPPRQEVLEHTVDPDPASAMVKRKRFQIGKVMTDVPRELWGLVKRWPGGSYECFECRSKFTRTDNLCMHVRHKHDFPKFAVSAPLEPNATHWKGYKDWSTKEEVTGKFFWGPPHGTQQPKAQRHHTRQPDAQQQADDHPDSYATPPVPPAYQQFPLSYGTRYFNPYRAGGAPSVPPPSYQQTPHQQPTRPFGLNQPVAPPRETYFPQSYWNNDQGQDYIARRDLQQAIPVPEVDWSRKGIFIDDDVDKETNDHGMLVRDDEAAVEADMKASGMDAFEAQMVEQDRSVKDDSDMMEEDTEVEVKKEGSSDGGADERGVEEPGSYASNLSKFAKQ